MTAREEDILTSQNLIKKGVVIDTLLNSLILTKGITTDDLVLGDKNAVMVAARILAYGPEYPCQITNPTTGELVDYTFNLANCPFRKVPEDVNTNNFEFELPISEKKVTFKLLTGKEEKAIENELKQVAKLGSQITKELTTRLKHSITSIDGDDKSSIVRNFIDNMLSRDSLALRKEITRVTPDIEMSQEIELGGETVEVDIPLTADFFWPDSTG